MAVKKLSKWILPAIIVITLAVIGINVPRLFSPAPGMIAIATGGIEGVVLGMAIVMGIGLLFGNEEDTDEMNKKKDRSKRKKIGRTKEKTANTYSFEKKKEAKNIISNNKSQPVKSIFKLDEGEEPIKTRSTSQSQPVKSIFKLDDEEEPVKTRSTSQNQPVKSIFKLDDEEEPVKTRPTSQSQPIKSIFKLDDDEDIDRKKTYHLNKTMHKNPVIFKAPNNNNTPITKNNLYVNEEQMIQDMKKRLEQLKQTLIETQKHADELLESLNRIAEDQKDSYPKIKTKL